MNLEELNQGDSEQACIELLKCCGSIKWVNNILAARPFSSVAHLHVQAEKIWLELGKDAYTELRQLGAILLQMDTLEERDNINSLRLYAITIQNGRKQQVMKYYCYKFNKKTN